MEINSPIPVSDIKNDPSMASGVACLTNKIDIDGDLQKVIESLYNNSKSFLHSTVTNKNLSNNIKKSNENVHHHYDIVNDFYRLWSEDSMTYSCGYFQSPDDTLNGV